MLTGGAAQAGPARRRRWRARGVPDEVAPRVLDRFERGRAGRRRRVRDASAWVEPRHTGRGCPAGHWPTSCGTGNPSPSSRPSTSSTRTASWPPPGRWWPAGCPRPRPGAGRPGTPADRAVGPRHDTAHLRGPHLRLPDERPRLRAAGRSARGRPATRAPATARRPTSWSSTPARCGRTPTTSCTATSATCAPVKAARPGHADRGRRLPGAEGPRRRSCARAPWVDVVFGTHNIGSLPALLERARITTSEAQVEIVESLEVFPSTLPTRRESAYAAWVSISVGCNNTCTFCIVPVAARQGEGPPARRHPGRGARRWSTEGVLEVTLLGQNVNAYGVEFGDRLRASPSCCAPAATIDGLERVRFTSPHPRDFTDDVIEAMAETPNVMPQLHMPLQSGSDRVLQGDAPLLPAGALPRHPRPGPRRDAGRGDHHRHHRRLPRRDRGGLRSTPWTWCAQARFASAFTFQYSKRPGTPAAEHATTRCRKAVVQERYERLVALQEEISWAENRAQVGRDRRGAGRRRRGPQGRRDATGCPAGPATTGWCTSRRGRDGRVAPGRHRRPSTVTYAAPHHLVADGPTVAVRRTRAGDAWEARQRRPGSTPPRVGACSRDAPQLAPDAARPRGQGRG